MLFSPDRSPVWSHVGSTSLRAVSRIGNGLSVGRGATGCRVAPGSLKSLGARRAFEGSFPASGYCDLVQDTRKRGLRAAPSKPGPRSLRASTFADCMASLGPSTSNLVAGIDDDDDLCVKQAILGLDFELDSLTPGRSPGCQLRSSGSHPDRIPGFHQSTYFGTCQSPESAVKPSQAKPSQAKPSQAKPAEDVVAATHAPTHARMHSRIQPRAVSRRCLCCDFAQPVPASDLRLRVAGSSSSFTSTCDSSSRDRARRSAANRLRNPGLSLPWADRTALCRKPLSVAA